MTGRLRIFLGATFALTFLSWGTLVALTRAGKAAFGEVPFMLLYGLGGLGPTLGAYAAVLATREEAPLAEFHGRLSHRRLAGRWFVVSVAIPVVLTVSAAYIGAAIDPDAVPGLPLGRWLTFVPLFFAMIAGGGLEELGWRGVAQPELERRLRRPAAAVLVGMIWSVWHLPLFFLPGVGQYGMSFPVFAIFVVGDAMILAWLYAMTGGILPCVCYHASSNAIWELLLATPSRHGRSAVLAYAALKVLAGAVLVRSARQGATGRGVEASD